MSVLALEERDRRWARIRRAMAMRQLECLIIWGSLGFHRNVGANLRYICNATTEGYILFPLEHDPTSFAFLPRLDAKGWLQDWRSGHPAYWKAIVQRLRELHLERACIGVVGLSGYYAEWGFPHTTYASLANCFPDARFEDATDVLENVRRIKTHAEILCIEQGCEVGERAIEAVMRTARAGVTDYEVRAVIMDTLFREGCEPGAMLHYYAGNDITHAGRGGYATPRGMRALESGDIILTEFDARYSGYIAQFNQPFSVGEPSREWQDIFRVVLESFNNGLQALRPGITAGQLDQAFLSPIVEAGYTHTHPAFHGLGLSLEEPIGSFPAQPGYEPNSSLVIEAGMVLELEPQVVRPDGSKGMHMGCPAVVTENGCRLLGNGWKPELKIV